MKLLRLWAIALFALSLSLFLTPLRAQTDKPDIVEVIEISGGIYSELAVEIGKRVDAIKDNQKVKAVLLVVNSPGGGALASAHVYEELSKIKVPVVGWCDYMCASGGIYVLMAPSVKYIGVRSETISGSVGVIMQVTRFNRLLEWAKIDNETYKSGFLKDAGNWTRAAEAEEKKYLQGIVDELAVRFYDLVGKARPGIKNWADVKAAKIFVGKQAVDLGLVDAIMSRDEAIKKAKELSGSKSIFTREELRKMAKAADETTHQEARTPPAAVTQPYGDVPWLIGTLKEIRAGEAILIEYRLPYRF